jgi:hypothetical protein
MAHPSTLHERIATLAIAVGGLSAVGLGSTVAILVVR